MKPYEVELDLEARLLRIVLHGFWDLARVEAYERDTAPLFASLAGVRPRLALCLVDGKDFPIQGKEVTDALAAYMARLGKHHPDRVAIIVGNMLQKIQITRQLSYSGVEMFESEAEALSWLLDPAPAQAAGTPRAA